MAKEYHYVGAILEKSGEYDWHSIIKFKIQVKTPDLFRNDIATADSLADDFLVYHASTWYGYDNEYDTDGMDSETPFEFDSERGWYPTANGEVWVNPGDATRISEEAFKELDKCHYIADMTSTAEQDEV